METTNIKTFNYLENGSVDFSILDTIKTTNTLNNGFYNLDAAWNGRENIAVLNVQENIENFNIHEFPSRNRIESLFTSFFNEEVKKYLKKINVLNKTGILFYGKEGTGKSSIIKYYCNKFIVEQDAVVFNCTNSGENLMTCWNFIQSIRKIQDNPIIFIVDEIDGMLNYGKMMETRFKAILDGYLSIDNFICFASTNYIGSIPSALRYRESRFKYTLDIEGIQQSEFIEDIVSSMLNDKTSKEKITEYANHLKGSTLDEIKQFCIDIIFNIDNIPKKNNKVGFKK